MWKKKISMIMAAAMVLTAQPASLPASASQAVPQAGQEQARTGKGTAGMLQGSRAAGEEQAPQDGKGSFKNGTEGNFDWEFTAEDGVLAITGKKTITNRSAMPNYDADTYKDAPWYKVSGNGAGIRKVAFQGTVQSVGSYTFYGYPNLEEIDFSQAASLTTVGSNAFQGCSSAEGLAVTGADAITTLGAGCFASTSLKAIELPGVAIVPAGCFESCTQLTSVSLPKLAAIGERSFYGCSAMEETPDLSNYTDSTLPAYAFYGMKALREVKGLAGNTKITKIGSYCFANTGLEAITLPSSIRSLETSVFRDCPLAQLPAGFEKVTSIGSSCFSNDTQLTEAVIPASLTSMGTETYGYAFSGCTSLQRVELAAGSKLAAVTPYTFSGCTALEEVDLSAGGSLTSIGEGAFSGCGALAQVTFPSDAKLSEINKEAFSRCGVTVLDLPASVRMVRESAFSNCKSLERLSLAAAQLTTFQWSSIAGCSNLQQMLIYGELGLREDDKTNPFPAGITPDIYVKNKDMQEEFRKVLAQTEGYIGDAQKRPELQKIKILTEADKGRRAASLSIELEKSSLTLEAVKGGAKFEPKATDSAAEARKIQYYYYTDSGCDTLYDEENPEKIPEKVGIYYIKGYAEETASYFRSSSNGVQCRVEGTLETAQYSYDTQERKLTIKETVQEMAAEAAGESAEKNFASAQEQPWRAWSAEIRTVAWAAGVQETRIGDYMFTGMESLESISIPAGVEKIGKEAFAGCKALKTLELPAALKELGDRALQGERLEGLTLPEGLQSIGAGALSEAVLQSDLAIPDSVEKLGEEAFRKLQVPRLVLPEQPKFTDIPAGCFSYLNMTALGEEPFILPEGIRTLGANAFEGASMKRASVPESVTLIGKFAFYMCSNLKQVALLNEGYTDADIQRADVQYNYAQMDSIFAGTPDDLMILCGGSTYTLLGDATSYNYGSKLYSSQMILDRFGETREICEGMAKEDYPAEAYDAFAAVLEEAIGKVEQGGSSIFDRINAILAVEDDVVAAAGALIQASVEEAGSLAEEDYTASSWIDFFYPYDDLRSYMDTFGSSISREDIRQLAELNAEMAEGRRNLKPINGGGESPAPGTSSDPGASSQPGSSSDPGTSSQPGTSDQPGTSSQPGTSEQPGSSSQPGTTQNPAPTPGQQVTPTGSPDAPAALKKPVIKKVTSGKKKLTVKWKKVAGASGYQIAYSYQKNMKKAKKVAVKKGTVTKKTIGGLKRKKACYVRIRAWAKADGRKVYSSWSSIKKVKVK